ncbi:MAG: GNAT family N-acetyltransferase, partial [Selenomonadaceae bacterium]|nr:GNAT family N-acetyltransferase [Selenomonadaceae bacterium]
MLRKLESKDISNMIEWMHDPLVYCNFRVNFKDMTEQDAQNFIDTSFDDNNQHFAFTDAKDNYLGTVSLKNISTRDKNAEYAIVTRRNYQGTGAAFKATIEVLNYA